MASEVDPRPIRIGRLIFTQASHFIAIGLTFSEGYVRIVVEDDVEQDGRSIRLSDDLVLLMLANCGFPVPMELGEILPPLTSQSVVSCGLVHVAFTRALAVPNPISTTSRSVGIDQHN